MDYLNHHGAVIDLRTKTINISSEKATPPDTNPCQHAVDVLEDEVTIAPISSIIVPVGIETAECIEGVIESDQRLLLDREICVARGIAGLHEENGSVMLTNFSQEYKHLSRGTTTAYIEDILAASDVFAFSDSDET